MFAGTPTQNDPKKDFAVLLEFVGVPVDLKSINSVTAVKYMLKRTKNDRNPVDDTLIFNISDEHFFKIAAVYKQQSTCSFFAVYMQLVCNISVACLQCICGLIAACLQPIYSLFAAYLLYISTSISLFKLFLK